MRLLASEPSSIGKVLDSSIRLYVACFKKLLAFSIILALSYVGMNLTNEALLLDAMAIPSEPNMGNLIAAFSVIGIVSLLLLIVYIAMIYRIDNVAQDVEDSLTDAFILGLKKFLPSAWSSILYMIAFLTGCLLLVIPGLILWLSLLFFLYFITLESAGPFQALKESHKLVWGNWWRTMTVFLAPGVLVTVVYFILGFVSALIDTESSMILYIVTSLMSAFTTPFFMVVGYAQFHDLKLRKSGADLEARLAQ